MQYASCTVVMHEGKFKITKDAVSVPEIVLLRRLHGGDDVVQNIKPEYWKRVKSFRGEKQRLLEIYGRKESQAILIEQLFPGEFPRLPTSLRDIATGNPVLDGEDSEDAGSYDDAPAGRKPRGKGKAAGPVQAAPTPVVVKVEDAADDQVVEDEEDAEEPAVEVAADEPDDYSFLNKGAKPASGDATVTKG